MRDVTASHTSQRAAGRPQPLPSNRLPYFDPILDKLRQGDPDFIAVSGRHVHWGYWPDPSAARCTPDDFAQAQEVMSVHLSNRAGIRSGQAVLDAGCGFGGTVSSINNRLDDVRLVGLNIDERQLSRARQQVIARPGNSVSFTVGDACELPFADASFDHVLAVECIMHFPNRARFIQEAARVLRPGGRLTVSDFCPIVKIPDVLSGLSLIQASVKESYGQTHLRCTRGEYAALARQAGFGAMWAEDITAHTLPTYPVLRPFLQKAFGLMTDWVTTVLEWLSRLGLVRYTILSFERAV